MWFDRNRCADGVQALRHYRYDVDSDTGRFSRQPLHELASNGSDAPRYVAVAMQGPRRAQYIQRNARPPRGPGGLSHGWLRM
jgi:phage terminase large subunit